MKSSEAKILQITAPLEVPTVKVGASASDVLTRDFLKEIKGYEHLNAHIDRVGMYISGLGIVYYFFTFSANKVSMIEIYVSKHEVVAGNKYVTHPFEKVCESKLGRFLQIKDLDQTEIEYKHLIES